MGVPGLALQSGLTPESASPMISHQPSRSDQDHEQLSASPSFRSYSSSPPQNTKAFSSQTCGSNSDQYPEEKSLEQQSELNKTMTPKKLIHNQYNSPIDLYSMNNIRKTIEAHSEFIAPGVKGINFLKADTPINKQSEVYKLIKEQEEGGSKLIESGCSTRSSSATTSTMTTVAGKKSPSSYSTTPGPSIKVEGPCERYYQQSQQVDKASGSSKRVQYADQHLVTETRHSPDSSAPASSRPAPLPKCSECGQFIHGAFAKIHERRLHPQCFNCSTCGTSLKNMSFFTINDKLYCEIHAKQVAHLMNINYNFSVNSSSGETHHDQRKLQQQQQSTLRQINYGPQGAVSDGSRPPAPVRHQSVPPPDRPFGRPVEVRSTRGFGDSPATISTMFLDRSMSRNADRANTSSRPLTGIGQTYNNSGSFSHQYSSSSSSSPSKTNTLTSQRVVGDTNSSQFHQLDHHKLEQLPTTFNRRVEGSHAIESSRQGIGVHHAPGVHVTPAASGSTPVCVQCRAEIHGPYILAGQTTWCKPCSRDHFNCKSCRNSLLDIGFVEEQSTGAYYCEKCYEAYFAPICHKCQLTIKGDCLSALDKQWHPACFVCGHCRRPFGNSFFYLEDQVPYCERDWNLLFTTKCFACSFPIEAGDKWIEALNNSYHSGCFKCSSCSTRLEGSTFYCKGGKAYCRLHAR